MDLLKLNILQHGFLKQAKYMVTTPERSQAAIVVSETGTISKELLPMNTGYITSKETRRSWLVHHGLKISIKEINGRVQDEQVLLISERSYLPLNPFDKDISSDITPLTEIARLRHNEKRANAGDNKDEDARTRMLSLATTGGLILIGLIATIALISRWLS